MTETTSAPIAFLGLGAMGIRMVQRLLDAGFPVIVWNRSPGPADALVAAGAQRAATPADAARSADLVLSMVTDDPASEAVWCTPETGAIHGLHAGSLAVECSTLTPAWVTELAKRIAPTGAAFIDAPLSGSRPQADAGTLIFLAGGDADQLARIQPALDVMGQATHLAGPIGSGAIMKLVVNGILGAQVAVLAELLGVAEKSGIARQDAANILSKMTVTSAVGGLMGQLIAAKKYAPLFPIDLVHKDLRYIGEMAAAVDAEAPAIAAVCDLYQDARNAGHGGDNITAIAKRFLD